MTSSTAASGLSPNQKICEIQTSEQTLVTKKETGSTTLVSNKIEKSLGSGRESQKDHLVEDKTKKIDDNAKANATYETDNKNKIESTPQITAGDYGETDVNKTAKNIAKHWLEILIRLLKNL